MKMLLLIILTYLIGTFSSAYIIGKFSKGIDIRDYGSGNSGTTNALRVMGKQMGILTFIFDFGKGIVAALIGRMMLGDVGVLLAGISVVVGHNWPIFIGWKGGKGVAASLGVLLVLHWPSTLIAVIIGLIVGLSTKYVSLGSMCFLSLFPIIYFIVGDPFSKEYIILSLLLAIMAIIRHKSNIERLINGNENKLSW